MNTKTYDEAAVLVTLAAVLLVAAVGAAVFQIRSRKKMLDVKANQARKKSKIIKSGTYLASHQRFWCQVYEHYCDQTSED